MKKVFCLALIVCAISGCGKIDRGISAITGTPSEVCIDGITYLQFTSGTCVKVDENGKPVKCK